MLRSLSTAVRRAVTRASSSQVSTRRAVCEVSALEDRRLMSATIGGFVYNDANADGIHQSTEAGLASQTVNVYAASNNALVSSTKTSATGAYSFTLAAGNYWVYAPSTLKATTPSAVTVSNLLNSTVRTVNFEKAPNVTTATGAISGFVYNDANADGVHQVTEGGIANTTVSVYASSNNALVATTKTTATGSYTFSLKAGNYWVYAPSTLKATSPSAVTVSGLTAGTVRQINFEKVQPVVSTPGSLVGNWSGSIVAGLPTSLGGPPGAPQTIPSTFTVTGQSATGINATLNAGPTLGVYSGTFTGKFSTPTHFTYTYVLNATTITLDGNLDATSKIATGTIKFAFLNNITVDGTFSYKRP